jgi:RNA polymerase sigma factor (sigma-70 family)
VERAPVFATTHWSVVMSAEGGDDTGARAALERLCQTYWFPLYVFVRRRGYSAPDAEDLTQEFFARLLKHHWLAKADRSKGLFRSFLLMAIKRFLANEWDKARAQKRGGGVSLRPLVLDAAETRYAGEGASTTSPEQEFERQWALTLLDKVLEGLREEYKQQGKMRLFEALKACLVGASEMQPYTTLAIELGMSEGAIKVAVHRLRERYRERLKGEIAGTVASAHEGEEELKHLFRVFARR